MNGDETPLGEIVVAIEPGSKAEVTGAVEKKVAVVVEDESGDEDFEPMEEVNPFNPNAPEFVPSQSQMEQALEASVFVPAHVRVLDNNRQFNTYYQSGILPSIENPLGNYVNPGRPINLSLPFGARQIFMGHVYSIDPEGCTDADDAFSCVVQGDALHLMIHIADPTEFLLTGSSEWAGLCKKIVTRYPSGNPPDHLCSPEIIAKCSLQPNIAGSLKPAVTLDYVIDENFNPQEKPTLRFTTVMVRQANTLTYERAGCIFSGEGDENDLGTIKGVLVACNKIAENLKMARSVPFEFVRNSDIKTSGEGLNASPEFTNPSAHKQQMQKMIEEFAILANESVAEMLRDKSDEGIFRCCAKPILDQGLSREAQMLEVQDQCKAEAKIKSSPHGLLDLDCYTHFTSPLRRVSDCVVHFMLRRIYLADIGSPKDAPFDQSDLSTLAQNINHMNLMTNKLSRFDTKFRAIQWIGNQSEVVLEFYIAQVFADRYCNLIISKIGEFTTHIGYTIILQDGEHVPEELLLGKHTVKCNQASPPQLLWVSPTGGKVNSSDADSLPDLERAARDLFTKKNKFSMDPEIVDDEVTNRGTKPVIKKYTLMSWARRSGKMFAQFRINTDTPIGG